MAIQFSFGQGLLRAVVSLAFLSGVMSEGLCSQALTRSPSRICLIPSKAVAAGPICKADRPSNTSDATVIRELEIGSCEEFGVAYDDDNSVQVSRVETRRRTVRHDREAGELTITSTNARDLRPPISPPLLV